MKSRGASDGWSRRWLHRLTGRLVFDDQVEERGDLGSSELGGGG